jgi:hypothetical protein
VISHKEDNDLGVLLRRAGYALTGKVYFFEGDKK